LIASHGDFDHIGAKDSFSSQLRRGSFYRFRHFFPFTVGPLTFTNYNVYGGNEENEESLVLSLDFMGYKWLFTGDAPIAIEQKIIAAHPGTRLRHPKARPSWQRYLELPRFLKNHHPGCRHRFGRGEE
jgi:beta-lactamase superfamily II metal-dependent hydrolase